MSNGIVVDHKESGVRYAISESNFNDKVHTLVRELKSGETVVGFTPLRKDSLSVVIGGQGSPTPSQDPAGDPSDDLATLSTTPNISAVTKSATPDTK